MLFLYTLLSAAMFYLGSRALITRPIWSRYPARIVGFMDCPACTGFWWGVIWTIALGHDVGPFLARDLIGPPLVGLCTLVLTPIAAGLMQWALDQLGHVPDPSERTAVVEPVVYAEHPDLESDLKGALDPGIIPLHSRRGEPGRST